MSNTANAPLPRALRNAVRAAIAAHPGWPEWRAANLEMRNGSLPDTSQLYASETWRAVTALGIDVSTLAAGLGVSMDAATTELDPTTDEKEPAAMNTTAPVNAYEGKDVSDVLRDVLAVADGMIGIKLYDQLASAVAPLAQAAVAGPRIVEKTVTRTVTVKGPGGDAGEGVPVRFVSTLGTQRARDLFGLKAADLGRFADVLAKDVSLWDGTAAEGVPARDPHHVWDSEALAYLVLASRFADAGHALRNMSRVLMYGPAGTGKTSSAQQFAAATGRPFIRIAFERTTEAAELIGQRMPKAGGGTAFHEGALVQAMQTPGAIVLLDEPSFLRPGVAAVLQTILDTGCVFLKEDNNRRVDLAPGVVLCAADNTNLTGDETGRYADTMAQNIALQDRFAYLVPLDYMPESKEAWVLQNRTGIPVDAAKVLVQFASATRKNAATGQLTAGCSLRRLVAWATGCVEGVPSVAAFKASVMNAADAADREVIRGLEKNLVDHVRLDALVSGKPAPAAPGDVTGTASTPGDVASAKAAAAAGVFASQPVTA